MSEMLSKVGDYALQRLHGSPLSRIVNHLMGGQPGASGLQALVDKLRDGGLGDKVDSWVSSGPNKSVQPGELERAIGPQEADRLAEGTGMDRGGLMAILSQFLPRMVDGMTPQGRVPSRDDELPGGGQGGIGGLLSSILGRLGGADSQPGGAAGEAGGGGQARSGGLEDMLGGLLNKLGVGGAAGSAAEGARHPGAGAGGDAGMPHFGEMPEGGDRPATPGMQPGGTGPIRRT